MNLSAGLESVRARRGAGSLLARLRDYFRYHGLLAPGVRLLREMPMQGKATVVALAFVIPMLLLAARDLTLASRELELAHEAGGQAAAVAQVAELIADIQNGRAAAEPANAVAHLTDIEALEQRAGAGSGRSTSLRSLWDTMVATRADSAERWTARRTLVAELMRLELFLLGGAQADVGRLTEPDRARHEQLDALPPLIEAVSSLPGVGLLAARGDAGMQGTAHEIQATAQHAVKTLAATRPQPALARALDAAALHLKAARGLAAGDAATAMPPGFAAENARIVAALVAVQNENLDALRLRLEERRADLADERTLRIVTVAGGIVVGLYILVSFYRVMSGGLRHLQSHVTRMADGDLSARPQPLGNDEIARALASLGESLSGLGDLFATVREGVGAVSHASNEIAGANLDLAGRTETSAERLQQVVAGLARYSEQLDACGQRIDEAVGVVEEMRLEAVRSRSNMERLLERMASLRGKSREIGEIVEIIDGIAFRTNILALNASVEAAKAGESGRGFAVVAQEVRRLAKRSAESAREISDIVLRSTEDIEQGSALADMAGATLRETDRNVTRARESMQVIVALTREGQGTSQAMLDEVRELDKLTVGNRELVRQMADASGSLSRQGKALIDHVASFKLK